LIPFHHRKVRSAIESAPVNVAPFLVDMSKPRVLKGRDLVHFKTYTTEEIYTILATALDLKHRDTVPKFCSDLSVAMFSTNPVHKIAMSHAGNKLGAAMSSVQFDMSEDSIDFAVLGKSIGSSCNMIVFDSANVPQSAVEEFADGCTVPVVCFESSSLCPVYCLSEMMTLFEQYGYLRRVSVSYVGGVADQLLNTYVSLLPKLGMHFHYCADGSVPFDVWEEGVQLSKTYHTQLKEFENISECIYRCHTLSISHYSKSSQFVHEISEKDIQEMDLNWTLLYKNVHKRAPLCISKRLLNSENSLVWNNIANQPWIFMAIMVALMTSKFSPLIARPPFEGPP